MKKTINYYFYCNNYSTFSRTFNCPNCNDNENSNEKDCFCDKDSCNKKSDCSSCERDGKKYGGICKYCGQKDDFPEQDQDGKVCCWKCFDKKRK